MATQDHAIHDAEEESFDYNSAFPALPMAAPGSGSSPSANSWAGTTKFSVRTSKTTQVHTCTFNSCLLPYLVSDQ